MFSLPPQHRRVALSWWWLRETQEGGPNRFARVHNNRCAQFCSRSDARAVCYMGFVFEVASFYDSTHICISQGSRPQVVKTERKAKRDTHQKMFDLLVLLVSLFCGRRDEAAEQTRERVNAAVCRKDERTNEKPVGTQRTLLRRRWMDGWMDGASTTRRAEGGDDRKRGW